MNKEFVLLIIIAGVIQVIQVFGQIFIISPTIAFRYIFAKMSGHDYALLLSSFLDKQINEQVSKICRVGRGIV